MSDKKENFTSTPNTSTDTDSSVIFVGVSKTIKVEADVHKQESSPSPAVVSETPQKEQAPKRRTFFKDFTVPETQNSPSSGISGITIILKILNILNIVKVFYNENG